MNLEQQVISLDLSKRLYELGVKQESLFYWTEKDEYSELGYGLSVSLVKDDLIYYHSEFNSYSAFTASELLELIPLSINDWIFKIESNNGVYEIKYCSYDGKKQLWVSNHTNILNALSKMIIHLIENKLIEV